MAFKYKIIPVTPFEQNCTLIWCDQTNQGAVIDPGGDIDQIIEQVAKLNIHLTAILLTHGHLDHVGSAGELAERANLPIIGPHINDQFWLESLKSQSQMFGINAGKTFTPTQWLEQGDTISVGNETLEVIHCPGHTPGHVIFFNPQSQWAQVGDVLFRGSIGRTDFPQGDHKTLIDSIKLKLLPLGNNVTFIPGHGPASTLGYEAEHNRYLR